MFVLRLYGLEGCSACQQALMFVQNKRIPFEMVLANNDPIVAAGNKALNNGEDRYPVLICNLTKDIIVGFKEPEYERVCNAVSTFFSAGTFNISRDAEQPVAENPTTPAEAVAGTT